MSETAPKPLENEELSVEQAEQRKPEDINEMHLRAFEASEKKNHPDQETQEHIKDIEASINRAKMTAVPGQKELPKEEGVIFNQTPSEEPKQMSGWKKNIAMIGLAASALFFPKESKGQQKINTDKEGIKKEVVNNSNHEQLVDRQLMQDWNKYTHWLESKGLKGSTTLNSSAVANKTIEEYRDELAKKGEMTSVSVDSIGLIQKAFIEYKAWVQKRVKEGKAIYDTGVTDQNFMANLSDTDRIAGPLTSRQFPEEFMKVIDQTNINIQTPFGTTVQYVTNKHESMKDLGPMSIPENSEEK